MSNKGQFSRSFLTSSSSSSSSSSDEDLPSSATTTNTRPPRILYTPNGDQILELTIETLMGTNFEVRLPAKTLVASIKNRLQRSEGVPRHHLHIIHSGMLLACLMIGLLLYQGYPITTGSELPDECSLKKCGVQNGDKLKLVLAMRGGPINMRRVALPSSTANKQIVTGQELQNLMLKNKDQILQKMPKNGQVTVLLFREGDKVNVYHVMEKPDGSFSPISNDQSPLSSPDDQENNGATTRLKKLLETEKLESHGETENPHIKQRLKENVVTMNKMSELRNQLESLSMMKKSKKIKRVDKKRPPSRKSRQSKWSASTTQSMKSSIPLPPINASSMLPDEVESANSEAEQCTVQALSERSRKTSRGLPSLKERASNKVPEWLNRHEGHHTHSKPSKKSRRSPARDIDLVDLQCRADNSLEIVNHRTTQKLISTDVSNVVSQDAQIKHGTLQRQQSSHSIKASKNLTRLNLSSSESSPRKKWIKPTNELERIENPSRSSFRSSAESTAGGTFTRRTKTPLLPLRSSKISSSAASPPTRHSANSKNGTSHRPTFVANSLPTKKKSNKPRCFACNKKINITNTFSCRCGKMFCPKHRHPELHECTFDYKSEGRKQLEEANPVVIVPKLPKI